MKTRKGGVYLHFYPQGGYVGNYMCEQLRCYSPQKQECYANAAHRPFDGTSCGNKKWCDVGLWVSDNDAPSIPSNKCNTQIFSFGFKLIWNIRLSSSPELIIQLLKRDICEQIHKQTTWIQSPNFSFITDSCIHEQYVGTIASKNNKDCPTLVRDDGQVCFNSSDHIMNTCCKSCGNDST